MTVADFRRALANLPDDAMLCYSTGETILEVSQVEHVQVIGDAEGYTAEDDGELSVVVVS